MEVAGARPQATAVEKAMLILGSFSSDRRVMGVSEISRRTGVPKSSAFRLLGALVDGGLVAKAGLEYSPGPRVAELAEVVALPPAGHRLRRAAWPYLLDLYEATHQTVQLAVRAGPRLVCAESIYGHGTGGFGLRVGSTIPMDGSALGRAIRAFGSSDDLSAVREQRIAYDVGFAVPGWACAAAPLLDWSGRAVAALSLAGPADRFRPASAASVVREAAAGAEKAMRRVLADD